MVFGDYNHTGLVIGIDASRNRSGGAKAHLIGVLGESDPFQFGISEVHVWAYQSLLDALPNRQWLVKHNPIALQSSLWKQIWWQRFQFQGELKEAGCQIVLNTDAGTVSNFRPAVTMSRDMLSYEPGVIERYGFSKARLRLALLRYIQNRSLKFASGAIFLTRYAATVIQQSCGSLPNVSYIPHGVGSEFKCTNVLNKWPKKGERPISALYVSNAAPYKHQWVVVQAIELLRDRGHDITLTLIGGGSGNAQRHLDKQLKISDPDADFIQQLEFVPQCALPGHLGNADLFIFASSCENMPNTLLEAMAVGLPIACSNRGPMPEILGNGGVYFDPENMNSIADAVQAIIFDTNLRSRIAKHAKQLSEQYSWERCANATWAFLVQTYKRATQ